MLTILALIGVLMVVVCTLGLVSPQRFLGIIDRFSGKGGYVLAIAARILLGAVAWLAAPQSLLPVFSSVCGRCVVAGSCQLRCHGH